MSLPAGEEKAHRVAKGINQRVYLRAQSTARAPDSLILASFFWAPALC